MYSDTLAVTAPEGTAAETLIECHVVFPELLAEEAESITLPPAFRNPIATPYQFN